MVHQKQRLLRNGGGVALGTAGIGAGKIEGAIQTGHFQAIDKAVHCTPLGATEDVFDRRAADGPAQTVREDAKGGGRRLSSVDRRMQKTAQLGDGMDTRDPLCDFRSFSLACRLVSGQNTFLPTEPSPPRRSGSETIVMTRLLSLFLLVSIAGSAAAGKPAPTPPTFESHIRPLFKIYC